MHTISRRQLLQIATGLAAGSSLAAHGDVQQRPTHLPRRPEPLIAERVPERYTSLPFEAQQLGGIFADRMRVNVVRQSSLVFCPVQIT
jgi:hypothetical protein